MKNELLSGEKVTLREMRAEDLDRIYDWENRSELWYLGDIHEPLTKEQTADFISRTTGDIYLDGQLRLMIETNISEPSLRAERGNLPDSETDHHAPLAMTQTIGCIDLFDFDQHNQRAGVGILIAEKENREKGLAKEALNLLTNYCFEVLNFKQLYCHITVDNETSLHLFSACGYKEAGRNKDWVKKGNVFIDAVFMQRLDKL